MWESRVSGRDKNALLRSRLVFHRGLIYSAGQGTGTTTGPLLTFALRSALRSSEAGFPHKGEVSGEASVFTLHPQDVPSVLGNIPVTGSEARTRRRCSALPQTILGHASTAQDPARIFGTRPQDLGQLP